MALSDVVRREFKASDDERDRGLTVPADVVRFDDICYVEREQATVGSVENGEHGLEEISEAGISRWQYLDVYRPKTAGDSKLPVIVNVHGGGWIYGDKETYQFYCMDLCRRGFAVVNFSYRLAPEYKFPSQLEDTNMVFHWVLRHAEEYGFDIDRIYAVGDSAGANILALYAIMCTNREYAAKYAFKVPMMPVSDDRDASGRMKRREKERNLVPRAVALNCGFYDVKANKREMDGFMKELMPEKELEKELDRICVTKYINEDFPPTFLMTCYGDFLMDQAPLLEKRLKELGIIYESRLYGSEEHPLKHVFHCDIRMEEAKICNDETCRFCETLEVKKQDDKD